MLKLVVSGWYHIVDLVHTLVVRRGDYLIAQVKIRTWLSRNRITVKRELRNASVEFFKLAMITVKLPC